MAAQSGARAGAASLRRHVHTLKQGFTSTRSTLIHYREEQGAIAYSGIVRSGLAPTAQAQIRSLARRCLDRCLRLTIYVRLTSRILPAKVAAWTVPTVVLPTPPRDVPAGGPVLCLHSHRRVRVSYDRYRIPPGIRLGLALASLVASAMVALFVPVVSSLRMPTSYSFGTGVGVHFHRISDSRGMVSIRTTPWFSEAWYIPDTPLTEDQLRAAGRLPGWDETITCAALPPWVLWPREVIGANWSLSQHENYGTHSTAFGFPFRSLYGVVAIDEDFNPYKEKYILSYKVLDLQDASPALQRVLRALAPSHPRPHDRWIPLGVLPAGLVLNALIIWPAMYVLLASPTHIGGRARWALRLHSGRCSRCRYDIGGIRPEASSVRICPECGLRNPPLPRAS